MELTIETRSATLRVTDVGPKRTDVALVFLHYWGGSAATWRKVIALLETEVRCIALNQRGWGGSLANDGRYDLDVMADDAMAVATHLGIDRVILVGHSMGGKVAQIVAKSGPAALAGLVLVAPAPPTPMPVPVEARRAMFESYQSAQGVEQALGVLAGPSLPMADRASIVKDTLAGAAAAKREWTDHGMTTDLALTPATLNLPTFVLVGSLDKVENPDQLREIFATLFPGAYINELAGIGHLAPLEAPEATADACRAMLEMVEAAEPRHSQ